jgi:hypothetical protein
MEFDMIFGPAYKGIPLGAAVAMELARLGKTVPFAYNRKEAKDHGEGGSLVGAPLKGRVLIVDDVMSAGTAVRESIALIQAAGATPHAVAIALDRQEMATEVQADGSTKTCPTAPCNMCASNWACRFAPSPTRGRFARGKGHLQGFFAVEGAGGHGLQPGHGVGNARDQLGQRVFGVLVLGRLQPTNARRTQLGCIAGNANLRFKGQHVGRQAVLHQRLLVIAARGHIGLGFGQEVLEVVQEAGEDGDGGGVQGDGHGGVWVVNEKTGRKVG